MQRSLRIPLEEYEDYEEHELNDDNSLFFEILEYVETLPATKEKRLALEHSLWSLDGKNIYALCTNTRCRAIMDVTDNIQKRTGQNVIDGGSCSVCRTCGHHQWHQLENFHEHWKRAGEQHA